jgi:predicted enzyme related to lactoylglutathione lyase
MVALMERVTGIGGVFFRARDPQALARWYEQHLGIELEDWGGKAFSAEAGDITVWSPFKADTTYFGPSGREWMVNFRVRDLDAMVAQLRDAGVEVIDEGHEDENGRFGWAVDPEGNRFELWEPARGTVPIVDSP